jgi:hypothetical protein
MKAARLLRLTVLLPLLAMGGGCTVGLWQESAFDDNNEPAENPHLRLFLTSPQRELLVQYDEYSERHCTVHTRAYLLDKNRKRISEQQRPSFVRIRRLHALTPVPVFATTNTANPAPELYAVICTNNQAFRLYGASQDVQTCVLPVYDDGKGRLERAALTPLTAAADATIVGGVIGYFCLAGAAESGSWPFGTR